MGLELGLELGPLRLELGPLVPLVPLVTRMPSTVPLPLVLLVAVL